MNYSTVIAVDTGELVKPAETPSPEVGSPQFGEAGKWRAKFSFWKRLSSSQKLSLVSLVLVVLVLPLGIFAVINPKTPSSSRASLPVTPPSPSPKPTPTPPSVVLLTNGSFETDKDWDLVPDDWKRGGGSGAGDVRTNKYAKGGTYSFVFDGVVDKSKYLSQKSQANLAVNTNLYLSGWVKVLETSSLTSPQLNVFVIYVDDSIVRFSLNFPKGNYDWTLRAGTFRLTNSAKQIMVRLVSPKPQQRGTAYFDLVELSGSASLDKSKYIELKPVKATPQELQ